MEYATTDDIINSGRSMTADELTIASKKIAEASAMIRMRAKSQGKDFDKLVAEDGDLAIVANSVVVSTVIRYLNESKTDPAVTQFSQAAGGYSFSGTYAASGARVSIWETEWKMLGLKKQKMGFVEMFDYGRN